MHHKRPLYSQKAVACLYKENHGMFGSMAIENHSVYGIIHYRTIQAFYIMVKNTHENAGRETPNLCAS